MVFSFLSTSSTAQHAPVTWICKKKKNVWIKSHLIDCRWKYVQQLFGSSLNVICQCAIVQCFALAGQIGASLTACLGKRGCKSQWIMPACHQYSWKSENINYKTVEVCNSNRYWICARRNTPKCNDTRVSEKEIKKLINVIMK